MPFDAIATAQLGNNPQAFLNNNYCRIAGQGALTNTYVSKNAAPVATKILGGAAGNIAHGHMSLNITDSDCKEITDIGGCGAPRAFIGLDQQAPRNFIARIQNNTDAQHPLEINFLPAQANQIARLQLPGMGAPSIIMTDALTGCTVYTSDSGVLEYVYHANALAVAPGLNDAGRIYMRDLFRHFVNGTPQAAVKMFDRPFYFNDLNNWEAQVRLAKQNLGRAAGTIHTTPEPRFNVIGIRTGPNWQFYYQIATVVSSVRTGVSGFFKGTQSSKFKVSLQQLPAVPIGGVPNP